MKKLLALLMAGIMLFSFAACNGNGEEETTTDPDVVTDAPVNADGEEVTDGEDVTDGDEETEEATEVVTDEDGEAVTDKDGDVVTEKVDEEKTEKDDKPSKDETKKPTSAKVEDPSKWSTAQVLKYYQDATAKVVSQKPGYTKLRTAEDKGYKAGGVLLPFKSQVFGFLGIGAENKFEEKVAKGTNTNDDKCGAYLNKSTLTASDVTSAKAVKSGSNYVITINVKAGSSQTEGGSNTKNNSPIDKTGICVGTTDRSGFDHKVAAIVYDALDDIAKNLTMYEKSSNGKVVATIDAATGEIQKLVISWDANAEISKVYGSSGTLAASTTVTYTNFGW